MSKKKPAKRETSMEPRDLSKLLKDVPPGAWAALSHDRKQVLGVGNSMMAAAYQAALKDEKSPILIRMPFENEGVAAGVR